MLTLLFLPFLLVSPVEFTSTGGDWQFLVPQMPEGHRAGRIAVRVQLVAIPSSSTTAFIEKLSMRTGIGSTSAQGVRIEVAVPTDVEFTALHATVADGLVLQQQQRSFLGRVGGALLSIFRLLLIGKLVAVTDDLTIPSTTWALALGAPESDDGTVHLNTGDQLVVQRGQEAFTDHGEFVVCRAMLALTPWTELVQVRVRGIDRVSGRSVEFLIPRLGLGSELAPESGPLFPAVATR